MSWQGKIQCKVVNSTKRVIHLLDVRHKINITYDTPVTSSDPKILNDGDSFTFEVNTEDSDLTNHDLWTVRFFNYVTSSSGSSSPEKPGGAGRGTVLIANPSASNPIETWSRKFKQCDVTKEDVDSGQQVVMELFYGKDGFSIETPVSDSCLNNHYDLNDTSFK